MSKRTAIPALLIAVLAACKGKAPETPAATMKTAPATATQASATAAPASGPTAKPSSFDPDSVPLSTSTLPPFPYLDWPKALDKASRSAPAESAFDQAHFVAGDALRAVEGRKDRRNYSLSDAHLSRVEAMRNYDQAIKELGGVRIDTVQPVSDAFVAKNGGDLLALNKKLGVHATSYDYAAYLIRTPDKLIWIGIAVDALNATIVTLEEKAMEQSVGFVKAEAMKSALDEKGRIALYINFDTDRATIRSDGKGAVDEIVKLMRDNPSLKVAVEGHTDNSGDARHNKELSEQRAAAVVAALSAAGIDKSRLKSAGFGADKPLADNGTEEGRARNRRVELVKL